MGDVGYEFDINTYSNVALPYLSALLKLNEKILGQLIERLIVDAQANRILFAFGSGHSALLPLEIYHRAGGPSFMVPLVADYLLPTSGPPLVRILERSEGIAGVLLNRAQPRADEMIWIVSQSGVNAAGIDMALEAKKKNLFTVAFTSLVHSKAVNSRHSSTKKLYEICDEIVDLSGVVGDAAVKISSSVSAGPLSTLGGIFLAHSVLTSAIGALEGRGIRCVYGSVNTADGGMRNQELEERAKTRDPLLR